MGTVTDHGCASRDGQLAMEALGRLDATEHVELAAHLATCPDCRTSSVELASTVGALDTWVAGTTRAPVTVVPPHLTRAVMADLTVDEGVADRRSRSRLVTVVCGSVAAVVVAAVLVTVGLGHSSPPSRTVVLRGAPGVTATAVLVEQSWGTSLTIHERGLAPGQTFTVSMDDLQGRWWTAGSYRTTGSASVAATMACAARFTSIHEIRVTDPGGRPVLSNDPSNPY